MQLACSIVCYQNPVGQIEDVLASVAASAAAISGCTLLLTVIDNSPDDSLGQVSRRFGARYLHRPENLGYGAAHNLAFEDTLRKDASFHLVLNPDVRFTPDVLPALVNFLVMHPDVGLVMPDIRYPDGRRQFLCKLLPAPSDLFLRRFCPKFYVRSGRRRRYELRASGYSRVMDVPALSGCFMLFRTSVLRSVGGFDTRFFMYLEDVDLSRRAGEVARTVFYPGVAITHEYVKGSYRNSKLLFYHMRSAISYFNKWGWIFDRERVHANQRCVESLSTSKASPELQ